MLSQSEWITRAGKLAARVQKPVALYMTPSGPTIDVSSPTLEPFILVQPDGSHYAVKQKEKTQWKS